MTPKKWWLYFRYGLHWNKPFYPLRVARNMILGKTYAFLGIRKFVLRGVMFQITYKCNFNCKYCLCKKLIEPNRELMTVDDYRRVRKQAIKMGCTVFGIEGGEPFLRPDWEDIVKALKPKHNHINCTTNSSLLTEEMIIKLKDLGFDTINLSLDSGSPEIHDNFRCKGSYDNVIKALEWSKKHGIKPVLNTVVTKINIYGEGFAKLMDIAEKHDVWVNTLFVKATGNWTHSRDFMLDEKDIEYYYNVLRKKYPRIIRHQEYNYGEYGCHGAKEHFNITPYGDVFICANCQISGGNVKEEDLKTIRDRMLQKEYFYSYMLKGGTGPCLLSEHKKFMNTFYPLIENRIGKPLSLEEFDKAWEKAKKEGD